MSKKEGIAEFLARRINETFGPAPMQFFSEGEGKRPIRWVKSPHPVFVNAAFLAKVAVKKRYEYFHQFTFRIFQGAKYFVGNFIPQIFFDFMKEELLKAFSDLESPIYPTSSLALLFPCKDSEETSKKESQS